MVVFRSSVHTCDWSLDSGQFRKVSVNVVRNEYGPIETALF